MSKMTDVDFLDEIYNLTGFFCNYKLTLDSMKGFGELRVIRANGDELTTFTFLTPTNAKFDVFKEYIKIVKKQINEKDSVVESVINKFKQRSEVGIKKYGTTLDRNDLTKEQWIDHAIEEAMDFVLYLTKLKQEIGSGTKG